MSTVTINGQTTSVFDAIQWCSKNFGQTWGDLKHQFPGWHWRFSFKDPEQAVLFALKWL
jgi:hypothetical protein